MKKISLVLLLFHWLTALTAQHPYSKAVNEQIARVETSLSGDLVIDGKLYTLTQRMKQYHVAELSVAIAPIKITIMTEGPNNVKASCV